jgi:hypothetical protein
MPMKRAGFSAKSIDTIHDPACKIKHRNRYRRKRGSGQKGNDMRIETAGPGSAARDGNHQLLIYFHYELLNNENKRRIAD